MAFLRFLILGDVIGNPGRRALKRFLEEYQDYDLLVVNGENAAGGFGITKKVYESLKSLGVDVITTGNHAWDKKEIFSFIEEAKDLLRPANHPPSAPGRGWTIVEKKGVKVAVINLMGLVFMNPYLENPFLTFDRIAEELRGVSDLLVVDFHGEATSEKNAFLLYALGRAGLIYGTHTHVPTADFRIVEGKTAYTTDVGMTGVLNSVIGVEFKSAIDLYLKGIKRRFTVAEKGEVVLNALSVEFNEDLKPTAIERIGRIYPWEELKGIGV